MLDLSAGQVVADKYRIDGVIGAGGMGVVVGATHLELDQRVAIKFLRSSNPEALARFQREARLIVRLKSVHVARVFDVGSLDDDTPFIVMELLEGEDLAKLIDHRRSQEHRRGDRNTSTPGRLPVDLTVDYVLEACEAVAEAHTLGMVHRDLKPANLFLARGPGGSASVKVLDFGISINLDDRISEGTSGGLTNEGVALGSPGYMSPEQMTSSRDVDARTDIYSLGAILYRLAGGQNPYKGDSLISILASMAIAPLPPLRTVAPDVPEGFATIVERCLAQDRNQRPANVAELAKALAPFGSHKAKASAEQIVATMGALPRSNGGASKDSAEVSATMRSAPSSPSGDRDASPAIPVEPTAMSMSATEPLGATVVNPLIAPSPSSPSHRGGSSGAHVPLLHGSPSQPSYPPPLDRSATAPAKRQRRDAAGTNILAAVFAVALLAAVIAWVAFHRSDGGSGTTTNADPNPTTTTLAAPTIGTTAPTPTPVILFPVPSITASTTTTSSTTPIDPKTTRPTSTKPARPHSTTTHRPNIEPPSPTDVPGGRR